MSDDRRSSSLAMVHAKLAGMAIVWGASWPAGRSLSHAMPPVTAAMARFGVTALLLTIWLVWRGFPVLSRRQWLLITAAAVAGVLVYAICFMMGLERVEAGRASLVITLNPAMTMLLALPLFGEPISVRKALGMVAAIVGASIVLSHGNPMRFLSGDFGWGEIYLVGCVISWSAYSLIVKVLLQRLDPMTVTALTSLVGVGMLICAAAYVDGPLALVHAHWSAVTVFDVLFLSVVATVIGYAWYFSGIAALGAGGAAGYITLVPVFGVLSSSLVLGEKVDWSLAAGGAVAVLGLALMTIGGSRNSSSDPQGK